jgi:hypothetical protein
MTTTIRVPKPVLITPLAAEIIERIKHRAMIFKILVTSIEGEKRVILSFEDLGAAYHIRTVDELDRVIDGLQTIRDQVTQ